MTIVINRNVVILTPILHGQIRLSVSTILSIYIAYIVFIFTLIIFFVPLPLNSLFLFLIGDGLTLPFFGPFALALVLGTVETAVKISAIYDLRMHKRKKKRYFI